MLLLGCVASAAPGSLDAPASLDLGDVYLGQRRGAPVACTNPGPGRVTLARARVIGHGFTAALLRRQSLTPGQSGWAEVVFAPEVAGPAEGALVLEDPRGRRLASIRIGGRGLPLTPAGSVSVVAFGARGDGRTDDRRAFQAAADAAGRDKVLFVPRPPGGAFYLLSGVVRIHGSMVGEPGGERPQLRMAGADGSGHPGDADPHTILYLKNPAPGAVVTGLHLNGGRPFPPGARVYGQPEYSQGIAVQGARGLRIEDNVIEDTQGDSILLGGEPGSLPCTDVVVSRNRLLRPMRCAVFAGDTRGLRIHLNTIQKVVEYQAAIDFEPNQPPQADWDAKVAYNDFGETLRWDHGVVTSTLATRIEEPGGAIQVHDNWGAPGRYRFHLDLVPPGRRSAWRGNRIQPTLAPRPQAQAAPSGSSSG